MTATTPAPAVSEPDEFLRRARMADAAKSAPAAAMSTREQTIALTNQFTAFAAAGLPHVNPDLLTPVTAISLHDPATGDFIGGVQLPEELADTLFQALDALRRAQEDAAPAEHTRAADAAPARRFSVLPGGVA
ncbi:hypothetical protein [Streptomyces himastatinicus]|uniref:hypothetical protein n=1 Tax=Streptomyces himastatinicus TaxID=998084 RepID=UPI0001B4EDA4|nr:hypothetical protein [Streptomyces himastatinicus]